MFLLYIHLYSSKNDSNQTNTLLVLMSVPCYPEGTGLAGRANVPMWSHPQASPFQCKNGIVHKAIKCKSIIQILLRASNDGRRS